jgi:hypothetical protein
MERLKKSITSSSRAIELKHAICGLFDVQDDETGVLRVITPLEYPGSNDNVVVRVRPNNGAYQIDENGEAAFYAALAGGDPGSESIERWALELEQSSHLSLNSDEVITALVKDTRLIAPYIFHVASASQQLYALATSHKERNPSDFKERLKHVVQEVCSALDLPLKQDVELEIPGGFIADYVIANPKNTSQPPLIMIAATGATRLLEAELIHSQYRANKELYSGYILAVAENEKTVGIKQFQRASYYTDKSVVFSPSDMGYLLRERLH